jgi:hypothetical protein
MRDLERLSQLYRIPFLGLVPVVKELQLLILLKNSHYHWPRSLHKFLQVERLVLLFLPQSTLFAFVIVRKYVFRGLIKLVFLTKIFSLHILVYVVVIT